MLTYTVNGYGDVTGIMDAEGELINEHTYDIWGKLLEHSETIEQSFRYSGEYWDEETNLQYLRARWYDPSIGRFINEDVYEGELTNPLSQNLYTYVYNNPLIYVDPTGNWCESAGGKHGHWGGCNGGKKGVEVFGDYKGAKYTPDDVYAKSKLVNLSYDDFPLWKQIGTALMNDPLTAVEKNKNTINRVASERGVSPSLIGAIIFREQVSRKDMDLFGSSVGLGAITPETAREAWRSIDISMILPEKDNKLKSKLKNDNAFNIETISVILLYENQRLGQSVINKTTVAHYNSSMSTADAIAKGNHYADQVYSYMEYIAILLK
ncbi:RHS repeat-associated core domain-containing protein [Paenibacillus yanchengensis]|uniref:RHS repeat-associated core domain-containing protein n=1 Tax=Paenibacillus yanchengensis TaxID=2035833 RepID=A0ABW4YHD1_9BACL